MFRLVHPICPRCQLPFVLEAGTILHLEKESTPACLIHECLRCPLVSILPLTQPVLDQLLLSSIKQLPVNPADPSCPLVQLSYRCQKKQFTVVPMVRDLSMKRWLDGHHVPVYQIRCRACDDTRDFELTSEEERYLMSYKVPVRLIEHSHDRTVEWSKPHPAGIVAIETAEQALKQSSMADFHAAVYAEIGF